MRLAAFRLAAAALLFLGIVGQAQESDEDPEARATARAETVEQRRQERRASRMDPVARETIRAAIREEKRDYAQAVEIRDPLPLPVDVRNPAALFLAGKPAGDSCPGNDECQLQAQVSVREVLIVTAVWSATKVECDQVVLSIPNTGTPIAPWWACRRSFRAEGPGAGYSGFTVTQ